MIPRESEIYSTGEINNAIECNFREIIEDKTDYRFYVIMNNSEETEHAYVPIYFDNNYTYYLSNLNKDDVLIRFALTNQTMS